MTTPNSAAQVATQHPIDDAIVILTEEADSLSECHTFTPEDWSGEPEAKARYDHIQAVVAALSKLRTPVAGERAAFAHSITGRYDLEPHQVENVIDANRSRGETWKDRAALASVPVAEPTDDTLTLVYDAFGIGALSRSPSTLLVCLSNVIRRANCLSQVERVLSVPTPPEPEDDGIWGEESLLRWGAEEKGYAEHFKAALAEWSRRVGPASAPVAGEAQPSADITKTINALLDQARHTRHADGEMGVRVQYVMIARAARYGHTPLPIPDAAPQASAPDTAKEKVDKILRERMAPISEALGLDVMLASVFKDCFRIITFDFETLVYSIDSDGAATLRVSFNCPSAPNTLTVDQVKVISQAVPDIQIAEAVAIVQGALASQLDAIRALKEPQSDKDAAPCTCPSGDGSLRHPCAAHPAKASGNGGEKWSDS